MVRAILFRFFRDGDLTDLGALYVGLVPVVGLLVACHAGWLA